MNPADVDNYTQKFRQSFLRGIRSVPLDFTYKKWQVAVGLKRDNLRETFRPFLLWHYYTKKAWRMFLTCNGPLNSMLWILVEMFRHQQYFQAWANSNHDDSLHCYNFVTILTKTYCLMLTCQVWQTLIHLIKLILLPKFRCAPVTQLANLFKYQAYLKGTGLTQYIVVMFRRSSGWPPSRFVMRPCQTFVLTVCLECDPNLYSLWAGTCPLFK